ncbi:MAG: DUF1153 domain-containing protein [Rhodobacterales bacterium]
MYIKKPKGPVFATLKDGSKISRADLPPPSTKRWVASRKAAVVRAVDAGLMDVEEVCSVYGLSEEEFSSWQGKVHTYGEKALKATATQKYRQP